MAKIAVVGAGLFGITIASKLAGRHDVDLFEKQKDILRAASGINQFRLHSGYHYPRSEDTVKSSLLGIESFQEEYHRAIIKNTDNYYCIAKRNTLTSPKQYLDFCKRNGLPFKIANLDLVNKNEIDLCLKVRESLIDPVILKALLIKKIKNPNLKLFLGQEATEKILIKYDKVIICAYAELNSLLKKSQKRNYQYEICEKIVVKLPDKFKKKSIVVLDGPFMCIDPFGSTGYFLLGNVVYAIHKSNVGFKPSIPSKFKGLLNRGVIKNPPFSNFNKFIDSASVFIPDIVKARYVGSMFTVRAVLPHKEKTDERPTLVRQIDKRVITVFSGKLVSSVNAAEEVEKLIS